MNFGLFCYNWQRKEIYWLFIQPNETWNLTKTNNTERLMIVKDESLQEGFIKFGIGGLCHYFSFKGKPRVDVLQTSQNGFVMWNGCKFSWNLEYGLQKSWKNMHLCSRIQRNKEMSYNHHSYNMWYCYEQMYILAHLYKIQIIKGFQLHISLKFGNRKIYSQFFWWNDYWQTMVVAK